MALDEAPPFWWRKPGFRAWALSAFSFLYGKGAARRMDIAATGSAPVPVLCVGNFITGGAGKTPTVIALADFAMKAGLKPGFLSRGYGGGITEATFVDLEKHNSLDVGDEPVLLAGIGPTVVSADRVAGAKLLAQAGINIIIMDDGFQNPYLVKDYCLVVVDSRRGLGNGYAMPAGPLRAPLIDQLRNADAVLIIGDSSGADHAIRMAARASKPVFHAKTKVTNPDKWKGRQVIAYAGIADPTKFFNTLESCEVEIVERLGFGDHHFYTEEECNDLRHKAKLREMQLVTTTKDIARLNTIHRYHQRLSESSEALEVKLVFDEPTEIPRIIKETFRRFRARKN